jgi:RimJ/RimL family protein N-acetyltransferase
MRPSRRFARSTVWSDPERLPGAAGPRYGERVAHIELRELQDDDLDAIFEMMRDPDALKMVAFTASDPDDRATFDAWIARERSSPDVDLFVVTERGGFAGTAALFTVDGEREVTCWIAHHAWGRGVATEALRLLTTREPIRPLFARAAVGDAAWIAVLERGGFTEVSRAFSFGPGVGHEVEEVLLALMPALDGA